MAVKVLVADDNKLMLGYLEKLLNRYPEVGKVCCVKNGIQAVEKAQSFSPDVILLDVEMPEMDGLTALKEIKALQKSGNINPKARTIILSGTMHENDANVRKAKFLGADGVFAKPGGKDMSFNIDVVALKKALFG